MSKTTMTDSDDRKDQICTKCGVGRYQETSNHDDWDGVLHCTNKACNHEVIRYKWKDDPKPQPEPIKSKLSLTAQAVLDAYDNSPFDEDCGDRVAIAAALRAAANQVVPPALEEEWRDRNQALPLTKMVEIRLQLLAIAAELEGSL